MLLTQINNKTLQRTGPLSPLRVLVLCTGNSARSIMAEAIFNSVGTPLFQAYSAGSQPTGKVNPLALEQIARLDLPDGGLFRSKHWEEFFSSNAEELDVVLTVCDNASAEVCPTLSPAPFRKCSHIHWGFPDPADSSSLQAEERAAFAQCFDEIKKRVESIVGGQPYYSDHDSLIQAMERFQ